MDDVKVFRGRSVKSMRMDAELSMQESRLGGITVWYKYMDII